MMSRTLLLVAALALGACATTPKTDAISTSKEGCPPGGPHTGMQPLVADPTGGVKAFDHKPAVGEKAICVVSGEAFTVTAETKTAEYNGKFYAFCCDNCEPDFKADPAKYAGK